jgi:hypothetical protein
LQEETLLYCKQCHTEVKEHALNAKTEYNASQPMTRFKNAKQKNQESPARGQLMSGSQTRAQTAT